MKVLARLYAGIRAIGADEATAWRIVTKSVLDSIPGLRLRSSRTAHDRRAVNDRVAGAVKHPTQTTRRALEDSLLTESCMRDERERKGRHWRLTDWDN